MMHLESMGINSYLNSFLDKTVLVTGASGFKGSWLCLMLNLWEQM